MENKEERYARLCHIVKWDDFDGYGFNLHAEKGKIGQYIGKVDEGSPSEAAGLKQGDRIIEVNEINIQGETHKQVVERIKAFPNETKLLVVDHQADDYFKSNNLTIKSGMPSIKYMKTPERRLSTTSSSNEQVKIDEKMNSSNSKNGSATANNTVTMSNNSSDNEEKKPHTPISQNTGSSKEQEMTATNNTTNLKENSNHENGNSSSPRVNNSTSSDEKSMNANGKSNNSQDPPPLNLKMSAKELRAKLAMRKKYDPKKEPIGFKDKFDIVQKL